MKGRLMKSWIRRRVSIVTTGVMVAVTGALMKGALGSDYCNDDVSGCIQTTRIQSQTCCMDFDRDGVFHLVTCDRHVYDCSGAGRSSYTLGPVQNCGTPGAICC